MLSNVLMFILIGLCTAILWKITRADPPQVILQELPKTERDEEDTAEAKPVEAPEPPMPEPPTPETALPLPQDAGDVPAPINILDSFDLMFSHIQKYGGILDSTDNRSALDLLRLMTGRDLRVYHVMEQTGEWYVYDNDYLLTKKAEADKLQTVGKRRNKKKARTSNGSSS